MHNCRWSAVWLTGLHNIGLATRPHSPQNSWSVITNRLWIERVETHTLHMKEIVTFCEATKGHRTWPTHGCLEYVGWLLLLMQQAWMYILHKTISYTTSYYMQQIVCELNMWLFALMHTDLLILWSSSGGAVHSNWGHSWQLDVVSSYSLKCHFLSDVVC